MTNKEFAEKDTQFKKACERVNLKATPRQASKYRRRIGKAFKEGRTDTHDTIPRQ